MLKTKIAVVLIATVTRDTRGLCRHRPTHSPPRQGRSVEVDATRQATDPRRNRRTRAQKRIEHASEVRGAIGVDARDDVVVRSAVWRVQQRAGGFPVTTTSLIWTPLTRPSAKHAGLSSTLTTPNR